MTICMVDLSALHAALPDEMDDLASVLRSGRFVGGPWVERAEAHAADLCSAQAAVAVSNGTEALILALQAAGVGPGDVVIAPALSFVATAGAIAATGAEPRLVDVGPNALMTQQTVQEALDDRVKAIVPVHLFGNPCDVGEQPVAVVADAAQAAGSEWTMPCALSALSTYPTKVWSGAGEGGFVVGSSEAVERARRLANHGFDGDGVSHRVGVHPGRNARMSALIAASLCHTARTLKARVAKRRHLADLYDAQLPPDVRPIARHPGSNVAVYAVCVPHRARLRDALSRRGIETAVYYPRTLHAHPAYADCAPRPTPMAQTLSEQLLALPVHSGLTDSDVATVCRALKAAL